MPPTLAGCQENLHYLESNHKFCRVGQSCYDRRLLTIRLSKFMVLLQVSRWGTSQPGQVVRMASCLRRPLSEFRHAPRSSRHHELRDVLRRHLYLNVNIHKLRHHFPCGKSHKRRAEEARRTHQNLEIALAQELVTIFG